MIPNLTGIRGLAAIWVMSYHFREYYLGLIPFLSNIDFIFIHGNFGVDLFFCLSGFVLAHVYFVEFTKCSITELPSKIISYLLRRFVRIYPIYFLCTIIGASLFFVAILINHNFETRSSNELNPLNVLANILAIQAWFGLPSLITPAWSVSAEFLAYMYFPFLTLFLRRRIFHLKMWTLITCALSFGIYSIEIVRDYFFHDWIIQVLCEFNLGVCAYLFNSRFSISAKQFKLLRTLSPGLILYLLYQVENLELLRIVILPLLLLFIVGNCAFTSSGKGLGRPLWLTLGSWSYSLYMTHYIWQTIMSGLDLPSFTTSPLMRIVQFLMIVIVPLVTAWAFTKYFEIPWRKGLLLRLENRP